MTHDDGGRRRPSVRGVAAAAAVLLAATLGLAPVAVASTAARRPPPPIRILSVRLAAVSGRSSDFPDPDLVRFGDRYVAYGTQSGGDDVPTLTSSDLGRFRRGPDALPVLGRWAVRGHTWAPSVAWVAHVGFVMFYVARELGTSLQCIGRATSRRPLGPFVDRSGAPFLCQRGLGGSIDPSVFVHDGTTFLLWKNDGNAAHRPVRLYAQRLESRLVRVAGPRAVLLRATSPWEGGVIEGPAMVADGDGELLLFGGGDWATAGYAIGDARCTSPLGPCRQLRGSPMLTSGHGYSGPGGPSFVRSRTGRLIMAFSAWRGTVVGYPRGVRSLVLARLELG